MKKLTICIPTFNRIDALKDRLDELAHQPAELLKSVSIYIFDNASDRSIQSAEIPSQLKNSLSIRYRVSNVGMTQNIIRCYEESGSDIVTVLGDDDQICDHYLKTLLDGVETLKNDSGLFGIFYKTVLSKKDKMEDQIVRSLPELMDSVNSFGNFLFVSTWLVRREAYLKFLFHAQIQASGGFGIIAPHLLALKEGQGIVLSSSSIVDYKSTPLEEKWSWFRLVLNLPLIFDLKLGLSEVDFKKLQSIMINLGHRNLSFFYECLLAEKEGNINYHDRYLFNKVCLSSGHLMNRQRVPAFLLRAALKYSILRPLVSALNRLTGSVSRKVPLQVNAGNDRSL